MPGQAEDKQELQAEVPVDKLSHLAPLDPKEGLRGDRKDA